MSTWPPDPSDLNGTEHLWDMLNKQVSYMEALAGNLQDLKHLSAYLGT